MNTEIKELTADELKSINKILIIQQKPFGDILLNTGYFPELRKKFPDAQIDYLIQKPYLTILEDNPHIDNLVVMDKNKGWKKFITLLKVIYKIRMTKYDVVIDQLRGTSSVRIVLLSGARWRLGFKLKTKKYFGITFNRWNWLYNLSVPKTNTRYFARWKFDVLQPLGISEVDHNIFYHIKPESITYIENWLKENGLVEEKLVIFSPGTPVRKKQWDLDYYAKLADMIQTKTDMRIILLWGPGEKNDALYIKHNAQTKLFLAPPTTFNQAGALLKAAVLLITNDGGINHLAVSQEVPSIAIFGPKSNPKKWSAWHKSSHIYLRDWNFKDPADNRFNISPEQVYQKFTELTGKYEKRD